MTQSQLEKRLLGNVVRASADYRLLEPDDRVLVAVSGGKDSHAMLYLLREIARRAPFPFSLVAVNIDQGHPGFPKRCLPDYFEAEGYDYRIVEEDTYSVVTAKVPEGKTYCSLCSRLRRGILYTLAKEMGATKIALGHHRDDLVETLMLNLLYSGQMKAMPPRLVSDDGQNVVIRPLAYCAEADLEAFALEKAFPIVPCDLCGSQDDLKRKRVKRMISDLHAENPNVRGNLFAALGNVRPTHLLDRELSRALGLEDPVDEGEAPRGAPATPEPAAKEPRRLPLLPIEAPRGSGTELGAGPPAPKVPRKLPIRA
jgi:tRNA 2-thiocytidine biosynthesis protein TtcA